MSYNPKDYTRCEKCKHIDRENEKCKITNDNWLVSDRAGTCHQFEGVESVNCKSNIYFEENTSTYCDVCNNFVKELGGCQKQLEREFEIGKDVVFDDKNGYQCKYFELAEETSSVNHPSHYNKGKFEVIDVIEDWNLGFNLGNTVKYIARCEHKENKKQDLEKAMWYLKRELERVNNNV